MKFTVTIELAGKTATGIEVPPTIIEGLNAGKRVPIYVTIGSYTYRSTVSMYSGAYMIPLAAEHRERAGLKAGQTIEVDIRVDTDLREAEIPSDFAEALNRHPGAMETFTKLAYSHRKEHIRAIEEAKAPETRLQRIEKAIKKLAG
jgi:bifunctional DNA-binding transcriptional regulator/antitoxin component of YhaV-PrlF toxin-antitoxin module